jgi:protein-S-isoprenylcysteine O-methyltransferase Ste14
VGVRGAEQSFFSCVQVAGLALFLVLTTTRTLHLQARKHINPIALRLRKRGVLGAIEIALFLAVNIWVLVVLLYTLPLEPRPLPWLFACELIQSPVAQVAGVMLIALAFCIRVQAMIALGDSWRLGLDDRVPGRLVSTGIYALSRNPIYIFFDMWFVGTFLINGSLVFLIFALFTIANLHYQIVQEEKFLAEVHGQAYEAYCARTARYLTLRRQAKALPSLEPQREL